MQTKKRFNILLQNQYDFAFDRPPLSPFWTCPFYRYEIPFSGKKGRHVHDDVIIVIDAAVYLPKHAKRRQNSAKFSVSFKSVFMIAMKSLSNRYESCVNTMLLSTQNSIL